MPKTSVDPACEDSGKWVRVITPFNFYFFTEQIRLWAPIIADNRTLSVLCFSLALKIFQKLTNHLFRRSTRRLTSGTKKVELPERRGLRCWGRASSEAARSGSQVTSARSGSQVTSARSGSQVTSCH